MEYVVYRRPQRQVALNCIRLHKLRITVPSIVNEEKHKIIIILLSIFLIWCLFTIVTTMTTNEKQSRQSPLINEIKFEFQTVFSMKAKGQHVKGSIIKKLDIKDMSCLY